MGENHESTYENYLQKTDAAKVKQSKETEFFIKNIAKSFAISIRKSWNFFGIE